MKALFLIIVLVVLVYSAWHIMPKKERNQALRKITPHAIRLVALIAVVIALAYAAYYLPSASLTF